MLQPQVIAVMQNTKSARLTSGPGAFAIHRCSVHAAGVARPFAAAAGGNTGGGNAQGLCDDGLRCGDQAEPFELVGVRLAAGVRRADLNARKVRRILVLEIEAAGDARCAAGGGVGAGAFAEATGEVLVLDARQREPRLIITGRGLDGEERGAGEGRELIGFEIVELDEGHAVARAAAR